MFYLRMAGLSAAVHNHFPLVEERCRDYIVPAPPQLDIDINLTEDDLQGHQQFYYSLYGIHVSEEEAEFNEVHHRLFEILPDHGRFWIHASLVGLDGNGYAFFAPSGTGKTTHAKIWCKAFAGRARIINGDAPVISQKDGIYYAWGTPFCGKERYQVNTCVPLKGLAFIQRSETNSIEPLSPAEAFGYMVNDHRTWIGPHNQEHYLDLLQQFAETIPLYRLTANMDQEAARVAYEGMSQGIQLS